MSDKRLSTKREIALNLRGADAALSAATEQLRLAAADVSDATYDDMKRDAEFEIKEARRFLRYAKAVYATGRKTMYISDLDKLFDETA